MNAWRDERKAYVKDAGELAVTSQLHKDALA
jgi:hypothetical protein